MEVRTLRILIANEDAERLALMAEAVESLGHEVVASAIKIAEVRDATIREHPDVALVALGEDARHALVLIKEIVAEAECPVIAILTEEDHDFIREAAAIGIFAYVAGADPESLSSSLEIVLPRFADYHGLQDAFGRRAVIERAKGMLMERHGFDEHTAFEALRSEARGRRVKIVDVAEELLDGRLMLPPG